MTAHNYSSPGVYKVQVNITAFMSDITEKYGYITYFVHLLGKMIDLS